MFVVTITWIWFKMFAKVSKKIFSQIVVKIGDESHGFESVKKAPTKTNTSFPPLHPKKHII